jgi:hypothetical protein
MTLSSLLIFRFLIACHIITGASGAIAFWIPIMSRKGGVAHRKWGRIFARLMLATGTIAGLMSITTLIDPMETHPHLAHVAGFEEPQAVRAIFGWMMLYLAILTINLVWQGWLCVMPGRNIKRLREWPNMALQALLFAASANCAWRGIEAGQLLMVGISMIGFATVATNLWFIAKAHPTRAEWLREHIKAIVGAGISVYTAFFAFGAVRMFPELALHPAYWSIPLITGLAIILWHWRAVSRQYPARAARTAPTPGE